MVLYHYGPHSTVLVRSKLYNPPEAQSLRHLVKAKWTQKAGDFFLPSLRPDENFKMFLNLERAAQHIKIRLRASSMA